MSKPLPKTKARTPEQLSRQLLERIHDRSAVVGIVGLGYVGLPFAVDKARAGFRVIGIEKDARRCASLNRGENYVPTVKDIELRELTNKGRLTAYPDYSYVPDIDILVITVPTPITRGLTPDLQDIKDATGEIAKFLRPGQLICLESTTFPGTTAELVRPILEAGGLRAERDFFLGYSPERLDPGNRDYEPRSIPRVVSGVGDLSLELISTFHAQTVDTLVPVSSTQAAELVKLFENTFRAVNLALVNEFARLCDRLDLNVWEILDAAFTKPYGIMPFYPGPGVGGHCTPVDPHYLEWKAKELNFYTQFIDLAGRINRGMPAFVLQKALRILIHNEVLPAKAKVLVLGVAYKKDIPDCRNSPAVEVIQLLQDEGVSVKYHDPHVSDFHEGQAHLKGEPFLTPELIKSQDLVIIVTDHSAVDYGWVVEHAKAVLDTRNATRGVSSKIEKIHLL